MILYLLALISKGWGWKVPTVFHYSSTRMILAAMTTLLLTILLGPRCIKILYEMKTGQSIRVEDCPMLAELHRKKKDTPTMGGILILISMLIALLLWMDLRSAYTWILFATTVVLGAVGGYDDYLKLKHKNSKGLAGKKKLFIQVSLAALIGIYLVFNFSNAGTYFVPFLKGPLFVLSGAGLILAVIFTTFVVTAGSNAVNLTDGLDGLASGSLVLVAGVLAAFAFLSNNVELSRYLNLLYIEGSGEIGVYLCALMGACLGFLWYNGYPAQVFMGDTGSLALGGVVAVAAVLLRREVLFGLVGGIFVAEAASVILQVASFKYRNKKRIFLCAPLHHHFEYKGWPETKVVLRFWIVGLILAMFGLMSLKFQ